MKERYKCNTRRTIVSLNVIDINTKKLSLSESISRNNKKDRLLEEVEDELYKLGYKVSTSTHIEIIDESELEKIRI